MWASVALILAIIEDKLITLVVPEKDLTTGELKLNAPNLVRSAGQLVCEKFGVDPDRLGLDNDIQEMLIILFKDLEIVNASEAARILGFSRQRMGQLVDKSSTEIPTPEPVIIKDKSKFWLTEEIIAFRDARQPIRDAKIQSFTQRTAAQDQ